MLSRTLLPLQTNRVLLQIWHQVFRLFEGHPSVLQIRFSNIRQVVQVYQQIHNLVLLSFLLVLFLHSVRVIFKNQDIGVGCGRIAMTRLLSRLTDQAAMRDGLPDVKSPLKALGHGQGDALSDFPFRAHKHVTCQRTIAESVGIEVLVRFIRCWWIWAADERKHVVVGGIRGTVGNPVDWDLLKSLWGDSVYDFDTLRRDSQVDTGTLIVVACGDKNWKINEYKNKILNLRRINQRNQAINNLWQLLLRSSLLRWSSRTLNAAALPLPWLLMCRLNVSLRTSRTQCPCPPSYRVSLLDPEDWWPGPILRKVLRERKSNWN